MKWMLRKTREKKSKRINHKTEKCTIKLEKESKENVENDRDQ